MTPASAAAPAFTMPVIRDMRIVPVAAPDVPLLNLSGLHAPQFTRVIVEITAANGMRGTGEVPGAGKVVRALEAIRHLLIGRSPAQLGLIVEEVKHTLAGLDTGGRGIQTFDQRVAIHAAAAVEAAVLDLLGWISGCPVCDILGRRVRDAVPFLGYLFYVADVADRGMGYQYPKSGDDDWFSRRWQPAMDAAGIAAQARLAVSQYGFTTLKLKGGVFPAESEADAMEELHRVFPSAELDIDPNGAWGEAEAVRTILRLRHLLAYVEDPVAGREAMARVRQLTGVRQATNMCACDWRDLLAAIRLGSIDIPLADPHFWTMTDAVNVARLCDAWGLTWGVHSNNHLDVSLLMVVHCGAVAPGSIRALDTHWIWQDGTGLASEPVLLRDGCVEVPKSPGLGIVLDETRLQAAHERYLALGGAERDDSVAMQVVRPGWKFRPNRPCLAD